MELLNLVQRYGRDPGAEGGAAANGNAGSTTGAAPHAQVRGEALDALLLLLAVMSPHVTAELWERRHPDEPSVHLQHWPSFDPELVRQDTVTMVIQVNGKVRDRIEVDAGISEGDAEAAALASAKVIDALGGAAPQRVVVRPPRLVNVVA
jgi:leucyl-tRNA synthetase